MSIGRWNKYEKLNELILDILKAKQRQMTTNEILTQLNKKHYSNLNWHTLKNYLEGMAKSGEILENTIKREKGSIHNWMLPPPYPHNKIKSD